MAKGKYFAAGNPCRSNRPFRKRTFLADGIQEAWNLALAWACGFDWGDSTHILLSVEDFDGLAKCDNVPICPIRRRSAYERIA